MKKRLVEYLRRLWQLRLLSQRETEMIAEDILKVLKK